MLISRERGNSPAPVRPKNIALFMDGTWNKASSKNVTNVRKLFNRAYSQTGQAQVVHYITGVGTNQDDYEQLPLWARRAGIPQESHNIFARLMRKCAGGAFGYGMSAKIMEAYAFLVAHYTPGDRIFLFGFSRGAYAVRALTCFVEEVGLLLKEHLHEVELAYRLYRSGDEAGIERLSRHLIRITGIARAGNDGKYVLPVHMMGVWDTVGALKFTDHHVFFRADNGVIEVPQNISHARHALALHELRPQFAPLYWKNNRLRSQSTLKQVWFAGAHADVGGGYSNAALSDIALEWMACEAKKLGLEVSAYPTRAEKNAATSAVTNSISPGFAYVSPALREFLEESETDFFQRDLSDYAVHQTACLRLSGDAMPTYGFLVHEINQIQNQVDEATVNLVWALGLTKGQLPLGTAGCDPGDDESHHVEAYPVVPQQLQNLKSAGVSSTEAAAIIKRHLNDGTVRMDTFAVSLLVQIILHGDVELRFIKEQLQLLCSEFEEILASSGTNENEIAEKVKSVSHGLSIAATIAPTSQMRRMLQALALHTQLSYFIRRLDRDSIDKIKRRIRKV